jgi:hypothetical protein
MVESEIDAFEEYFYRDLEKGYSADIACCDRCCDEFLAVWPYADYAVDQRFQTARIDLDFFYDGSYLRDVYTKGDFRRLVRQLRCPRCGGFLTASIWAYNFPFDLPTEIEQTIREVADIARVTPFLLLEHEFCKRILSTIRAIASPLQPQRVAGTLCRGRALTGPEVLEAAAEFDRPPESVTKEGRYNHAGQPVLYLGSDVETCHAELRHSPALFLEFELLADIRILDLLDPYKATNVSSTDADLLNCLVYSALVSARQEDDGWHRPHYVVSRFVADCARAAGVDAIRYPSTRRIGRNFNLVIVNRELRLASLARIVRFHRRGSLV